MELQKMETKGIKKEIKDLERMIELANKGDLEEILDYYENNIGSIIINLGENYPFEKKLIDCEDGFLDKKYNRKMLATYFKNVLELVKFKENIVKVNKEQTKYGYEPIYSLFSTKGKDSIESEKKLIEFYEMCRIIPLDNENNVVLFSYKENDMFSYTFNNVSMSGYYQEVLKEINQDNLPQKDKILKELEELNKIIIKNKTTTEQKYLSEYNVSLKEWCLENKEFMITEFKKECSKEDLYLLEIFEKTKPTPQEINKMSKKLKVFGESLYNKRLELLEENIQNNTTKENHNLNKLKELSEMSPDDLSKVGSDEIDFIFEETNWYFEYEEVMKSYNKFETEEGWANALFHGNGYGVAKKDWKNFKDWLVYVYEYELKKSAFEDFKKEQLKKDNEDNECNIINALKTEDGKLIVLNYFKKLLPEKRFSLKTIVDIYHDMVDDNIYKELNQIILDNKNGVNSSIEKVETKKETKQNMKEIESNIMEKNTLEKIVQDIANFLKEYECVLACAHKDTPLILKAKNKEESIECYFGNSFDFEEDVSIELTKKEVKEIEEKIENVKELIQNILNASNTEIFPLSDIYSSMMIQDQKNGINTTFKNKVIEKVETKKETKQNRKN
jgi:hypothetical protein